MGTSSRYWSELKSADCAELADSVAILPLSATEQHGPHLPLNTDSAIMDGMLDQLCRAADDILKFLILPTITICCSAEHGDVPGSLSLSPETMLAQLSELGSAVAQTGCRKIILVTSHGGNEEVMGLSALRFRTMHRMIAVKTSWRRFGFPGGLFDDQEWKFGIHGGDYETSLMLHLRPELVDMSKAANFASRTEQLRQQFALLSPQSPHGYGWMATDLNPDGVVGRADLATAEKGAAVAAHQTAGMLTLIEELQRADPAELINMG